jgi:hypothetical protein
MRRLGDGQLLEFKLNRVIRNRIGKGMRAVAVHERAPSLQAGVRRGLSAIGACGRFADDEGTLAHIAANRSKFRS